MLEVRRQVISTAHDAEPGITVFGDAGQVPVSLNQWGPIFTDAPQNEMPTGYYAWSVVTVSMKER